jgi:hypothetical protein
VYKHARAEAPGLHNPQAGRRDVIVLGVQHTTRRGAPDVRLCAWHPTREAAARAKLARLRAGSATPWAAVVSRGEVVAEYGDRAVLRAWYEMATSRPSGVRLRRATLRALEALLGQIR